MGFYNWDVSGVWSCGHAVPWRQKMGFDLSCITCSQAGSWYFKDNKGDTMSAKQFITLKSIFKDESFVKGLPGERAIQKLVEIWWINGIGCCRSEKWGAPRLKTRKEEESFWLEYSKSRGWVDQAETSIFFFFLFLLLRFCFHKNEWYIWPRSPNGLT